MTVVTPTDCPKSVSNRHVIEVFGVFVLFLDFYILMVCGAFVIGLSQVSFFYILQ